MEPRTGGRRGRAPRVLPILLLLLIAAILLPGGFVFFALLKGFLLFWLLLMVGGMIAGLVFRHKARRVFRERACQRQSPALRRARQWQTRAWRGADWRGPRDDW